MAAINELRTLLDEDIRQLETLADLLSREAELLSSRDIKPLQALTEQKNTLLAGIRERAKSKIRLLVAMGYRPGSGEPSQFIRAGGMEDLFLLWKDANTKLESCQALNQNNGRVIGNLQKRLSRLTDIFRGASCQQKLYGANGGHTNVSSRTILASA